jgi:PAS domain-containing protein
METSAPSRIQIQVSLHPFILNHIKPLGNDPMNKPTYEALEQRVRDLEKTKKSSTLIRSTKDDPDLPYRIILENISDAVILTDDQGNMLYVCPNTTRFTIRLTGKG